MSKTLSFILIQTILVVLVIGTAFSIAGSPFEAKKQALDSNRLQAFQDISYQIESYVSQEKMLPVSIDVLDLEETLRVDQETKIPFDYKITGTSSYELCATFSTDSDNLDQSRSYLLQKDAQKIRYTAGYACIPFTLPDYIQDQLQPSPSTLDTRAVPFTTQVPAVTGKFSEFNGSKTQITIDDQNGYRIVHNLVPDVMITAPDNTAISADTFKPNDSLRLILNDKYEVIRIVNYSYQAT